ncbi:hypothetical protein E2562_034374 [Oryza meyeriana var. granulata]|uniref:Uncharacterized protein n=1 Tax=Oryza meyeriana var. granulata TaxID=110450 RepID=A0A6G1ESH4_9ORYZ|nr:hypothetical protein E2562_034374 [Oryza meyeriana var. granulata]
MLRSEGAGPSLSDHDQLLPQPQAALDALKTFVKEKAILSLSQTIAIVKSLYRRVKVQTVNEGFLETCPEEQAIALMDEVQGAAAALVENLEL